MKFQTFCSAKCVYHQLLVKFKKHPEVSKSNTVLSKATLELHCVNQLKSEALISLCFVYSLKISMT